MVVTPPAGVVFDLDGTLVLTESRHAVPADVEAGGRSPMCPVVALEGKAESVTGLVEPGAVVRAGDPLSEWA